MSNCSFKNVSPNRYVLVWCGSFVMKNERFLLLLTSSEPRCHHCRLQTSGLPMTCSNGSKGKRYCFCIISDLQPLHLFWTYLIITRFSSGVVFLCEVPQVVVIVEVEVRHQLLVSWWRWNIWRMQIKKKIRWRPNDKTVATDYLTEENATNAVSKPI